MKKKVAGIVIAVLIILVLVIVGIKIASNNSNEIVNPNSGDEQTERVYISEFSGDGYTARLLESENKDYLSLFVETEMFEGTKQVQISYDSEKYILDTANPVFDNTEIMDDEKIKSFEIEVEALKTYTLNLIKRNSNIVASADDVVVK